MERIAGDIVEHFTERGQRGKAMVVCIDKATAVKMYDKVKYHWGEKVRRRTKELTILQGAEKEAAEDQIAYMEATDMAVVVSAAQNEIEEMRARGVEIAPHRRRMVKEDLDTKFKDPDDPFRIVFVCAMWMTGFDVPSCNTIYLDKPMRNHTLMQTIARANRVFADKVNGLIVDYVGVFRNLQKALAIYAPGPGKDGTPIEDKAELVRMLKEAIIQTIEFLTGLGINAREIMKAEGYQRIALVDDAVNAILVNDETRRRFMNMANTVRRIFKAILPDLTANEFVPITAMIRAFQLKIQVIVKPQVDISGVMKEVEELLDDSVAARSYVIREPIAPYGSDHLVDLSQIDFKALKEKFAGNRKRVEVEKLRGAINSTLSMMVRLNKTRMDYLEKFQQMIDDYNSGAVNVEEFFKKLLGFARDLQVEEKKAVSENLSEEELAIFDLITKPEMKLTKKEKAQVKKIAHDLLETLKKEKLVLDWRKRQSTRAAVRLSVEEKLDELPSTFTAAIYQRKCDAVYQHIHESYMGSGQSVYGG